MKVTLFKLMCLLLTCCAISKTTFADHNATTVEEFLKNQIEVIDNATSEAEVHDVIKIKSQPTRITCNQTNTDLKIFKKAEGFLYVLSSHELLAVDVDEQKVAQIHFVGRFKKLEEPVLEIQIEQWQNMIVVVLKMVTSLHVFLTKNDFTSVVSFEPIQKININSPSDRFVLFKNRKDLFLVTYGIKSESANELIYFKWKTSFFSQESHETVDLPVKSNLFVFNENVYEPLILSIGFEKNTTRVIILKLNPTTKRWTKLQSLHFKQDYIEHYVVDGQLYLIGCSTESFCAVYKWTNSQFRRHIKINSRVFEKIRNVNYRHNIIMTENFQNGLTFYSSDDIVGARPALTWKAPPNLVDYTIFESLSNKQLYFVEFIFAKTSLAINFYEMAITRYRGGSDRADGRIKDAVECISRLKAFLKNRIPQIQASHQQAQSLVKQDKSVNMTSKKFLAARSLNLSQSSVQQLRMPYNVTMTGRALQERVVNTNIKVSEARRALSSSSRFDVTGRADGAADIMENIVVQNLIYSGKDHIFNDLLLTTQPNMFLSGDIQMRDLIANKLIVRSDRINGIDLKEILNKTSTTRIFDVKRFKSLKIGELTTPLLNTVSLKFLETPANSSLELAEGFVFDGDINVKHLHVKALNGFNVSNLFAGSFLQGEQNVIKGNLILQNTTTVDHLEVLKVQDYDVDKLLTTSTDQHISANVFVNKFYVNKLTTQLINDENLSSNFALTDAVNIIEVPTQFLTLHVLQNLNVQDETGQEGEQRLLLTKTIENLKQQVIGTQTSDLSQIYNGQVVIEGSLTINDIQAFSPKTRIVVNEKEIPHNISNSFWMKSLKQEIRTEKFTIANSNMQSGHVVTTLLNGHPIQDFVLSNVKSPRGFVHLRFENAAVEGDVNGLNGNIPSLLYQINQTAVPRHGQRVIVKGLVELRGKLSVRNLVTNAVNESPIKDFVISSQKQVDFAAPVKAQEVKINELIISDSFSFDRFNNVDIKNFLLEAKRIDQPLELESLNINSFSATNLNTMFFESHQFDEFIKTLESQFQTESIKRNLRIRGNVDFKSSIILNTLNENTAFNDFVSLLVLKSNTNIDIGGHKTFQSLTVRDNLHSKLINDFPLNRLLYQSLSRNDGKQTLSSEFFAKNLKTKEMSTSKLNKINFDQFIDKTRLHLPLKGNFRIGELLADNLDSMSSSFEFTNILRSIQYPKRVNWTTITANVVDASLHSSSNLERLISNAVYKKGAPQIITGKVQLNDGKVFIKKLVKNDGIIIASLNGVNLLELFSDSVKNDSINIQTVSGINQFLAPIYVGELKMEPKAFFESEEINNINVANFNQTIARPSDIISSEKVFAYLHADEIYIVGRINTIPVESIVFVTGNVTLPSLGFDSLEVDFLKTYTFSDFSLLHFLENRMRKYGPNQEVNGYVEIESLDILKDTIMFSINRVPIDELVFLQSDQIQEIVGHVSVLGNITLKGPSIIRTINEIDFVDFIRSSVSRHQYHNIEMLQLPAVELRNGLSTKHFINGHRINELLSSDAHIPKVVDLLSLMELVKSKISNIENIRGSKSSRSKRLLYIDYDPEVQITYDGSHRRCADEIVEASNHNSIIVKEKQESEMNVDFKSLFITVKPNLKCRQNYVTSRSMEIWWIYKNNQEAPESMRNFSFPNEISDLKFIESKNNVLMILTMTNLTSLASEISFLKLDKTENDWFEAQPKIIGFNHITISAIIETPMNQFLVVSSFDKTAPSDFVSIFQFDSSRNEFIEKQRRFSGEKFDIILSVNVLPKSRLMKARTFLILAKEGGRVLYIYRLKDDTQDFVFQRKIPFESEIVEVVVLHITDGPYFIVSLQTGDFCLFEWRGIENWKVKQCGHFSSINRIKTYEYLKRQHLFLASTINTGTALTVHRQGDFF